MAQTKNLCAQIPIALHSQVCEAREQSGLTTAEYITNLLIEYFEMKENGAGVWHHHERWDGSGYPDGQAGTEIPLYSRMIALCDSIDAMRSSRSYRKEMTDYDCRREIEKNAGIMYDPELTSLCLSNWDFLTGDLYVNI